MKIINGGIPGKPQDAVEIGNVYALLAEIAARRGEQTRVTDIETQKVIDRITAQQTYDYGNFEKRLEDHVKTHGLKHGENLETLGIPMVNDYPFGNRQDIIDGGVWDHYLDPRSLMDALRGWEYTPDPNLLERRNEYYTDTYFERLTAFNGNPVTTVAGNSEWTDVTPVHFGAGVMGIANVSDTLTYLPVLPFYRNSQISESQSAGLVNTKYVAYGWNAQSFTHTDAQGVVTYYIPDDFNVDVGYRFDQAGTANSLIKEGAWLHQYEDFKTGVISTIYISTDGIHIGVAGIKFNDTTLQLDTAQKFYHNSVQLTDQVILIPWSDLYPGQTVTVEHTESRVYGEMYNPDRESGGSLSVFANLNVDGQSGLHIFGWHVRPRFGDDPVYDLIQVFGPGDTVIDSYPDDHPFHPVYGRGVFKNDGGHVSAKQYGHRTYFIEHSHESRSLNESFQTRTLPERYPVVSEQRLVTNKHYSRLGMQMGRMFVSNNRTVINGQVRPNGEWTHYLCSYNTVLGGGTTHWSYYAPERIYPMAENKLLSRELVNSVNESKTFTLTGLVWSNKNGYEAIGKANAKVGGDIYGKPAKLKASDLANFKASHATWLAERDNLGYTGVMLSQNGDDYIGLEVRTDYTNYMDVTLLDVKQDADGEYSITRMGSPLVVRAGEPDLPALCNARLNLITDYYVTYSGGSAYVIVKHPFEHHPANFEFKIYGTKLTLNNEYDPEVNAQGLCAFEPVIMTPLGACMPTNDTEPGSGLYRNGAGKTVNLYEGPKNGPTFLMIDPDTEVVINGTPYDVPPGLVARFTAGEFTRIYLVIKNGVLDAEVAQPGFKHGVLYAVIAPDGTVNYE
ncbi:hypothetical protein [Vibrio phage phiKT1028]|nr:hypothetical protein [Vibrio phage phiKT1028]